VGAALLAQERRTVSTPTARFEGTPVTEVIALAGVAVFGILTSFFLIDGNPPAKAVAILSLPITASIVAVFMKKREIVWVALGLCLGVAAVAFPGSGFFPFWMGVFLFLWWILTVRRAGRPVVVWNDVFWEASAFVVMMLLIFA
jgi:hypothetical protein